MAQYVILGSNGFFGTKFAEQVKNTGSNYLLLDRKSLKIFEGKAEVQVDRAHSNIWDDISKHVTENTIIINCIWPKINYALENSDSHFAAYLEEISLIEKIRVTNATYVSFGSIKEYESDSSYSRAKQLIYSNLSSKLRKYFWFRIANCYGTLNSGRIIDQLFESYSNKTNFTLINPDKVINLYPIETFIGFCLDFISDNNYGDYNIASPQWVKLQDLKISFITLIEPEYFEKSYGPFSRIDPKIILLDTPPVVDYFKHLKSFQS
jgi:hypothetical protein